MTVNESVEEAEIRVRSKRARFYKRVHRIDTHWNDAELKEVKEKARAARLSLATYIRVTALMSRRKS